jgi:hypothetical protein
MDPRFGSTPHATVVIKDSNGQIKKLDDWRHTNLFTTVQLNNGQNADLRAFSQGISGQIPGGTRNMTRVDTNLNKAATNGLDRDTEMYVYSVTCRIIRVMRPQVTGLIDMADTGLQLSHYPDALTTFRIMRAGLLEFYNADKLQISGRLDEFPPGIGLTGHSTKTDQEWVTVGTPHPNARVSMIVPTHLKDGVGFYVDVKTVIPWVISQTAPDALAGGTALTSADFMVEFYGLGNKPVN